MWYALRTAPQREQKAKFLLRNRGFEAVVPTEVRFIRRRGNYRAAEKSYPLAVGYVLLKSPGIYVPWHEVFDAGTKPYIKAIVGFGGRPAPIADEPVESFISRSVEPIPYQSSVNTRTASFRAGDSVHVAYGPLRGLDATIEDITECRATIVLRMLGKSHPVALELSNLRAA